MGVEEIVQRLTNGATRGRFVMHAFASAAVTVREITQVIEANPTHPKSAAFRRAIKGLPQTQKLFIDKHDLLGVATNQEVVRLQESIDGVLRISKQLGDSLDKATPPAPADQTSPQLDNDAAPEGGEDELTAENLGRHYNSDDREVSDD